MSAKNMGKIETTWVKDEDGHTIARDDTQYHPDGTSTTRHYRAEDGFFGLGHDTYGQTGTTENDGEGHSTHKESGCFLTSACVEYAGLRDDCHELTVLRSFRDNYVAKQPYGEAMIAEYYRVAPAIVLSINQGVNRDADLAKVFKIVSEAINMIESGNDQQALALYRDMFTDLKYRYQEA